MLMLLIKTEAPPNLNLKIESQSSNGPLKMRGPAKMSSFPMFTRGSTHSGHTREENENSTKTILWLNPQEIPKMGLWLKALTHTLMTLLMFFSFLCCSFIFLFFTPTFCNSNKALIYLTTGWALKTIRAVFYRPLLLYLHSFSPDL